MAYKVNHTDVARYGSLVVEDKTINSQTSLNLIGKKYAGYAKIMAENLLQMMENFANINPPDNPVVGQLWYNSDAKAITPHPTLMMWDGTNWVPSAHISKSLTQPDAPSIGDIWIDLANTQLNLRTGDPSNPWLPLGSMLEVDAYGNKTGLVYGKINDQYGAEQSVIRVYNAGNLMAILSLVEFIPQNSTDVPGFIDPVTLHPTALHAGININPLYKFYGTSTASEALMINGNRYDASLFLRTNENTPTITNGLKINSNSGLTFGTNLIPASLKVDSTTKDVILSSTDKKISLQTSSSQLVLSPTSLSCNVPMTITGMIDATSCKISTSTETQSLTTNTISVGSSTAPGSMTVTGTIIPSVNNGGSIGTTVTKWGAIFADQINCNQISSQTPFTGQISPNTTISNHKIVTSATSFSMIGDVSSGDAYMDEPTNTVKLTTALKYNAINGKTTLSPYNSTDFTILDNSKVLVFYNNNIYSMSIRQLSAPIGSIILYAGSTAPAGYLKCDGSQYNIVEYEQLYHVIGTTYGGSGGKFNLPALTAVNNIDYYIYTGAH